MVCLTLFLALVVLPLIWQAAAHCLSQPSRAGRRDRSSAGILPAADDQRPDAVRIYAARTRWWRGVVAVHCWIVLKEENAPAFERWEVIGKDEPVRLNGFLPDGLWFGRMPQLVFAADGEHASALIPRMRRAIETYRFGRRGDYRAWPGPNSNTFVATVMAAVPETGAALPPTAVGKDFPVDGRWIGLTPSRTGLRVCLGGYAGVAAGWHDGLELHLLGCVIGLDLRGPAVLLPGVGRVGLARGPAGAYAPRPLRRTACAAARTGSIRRRRSTG